jgi:hypothetical protein
MAAMSGNMAAMLNEEPSMAPLPRQMTTRDRLYRQQLFEEAADLSSPVDEVNFQYPVARGIVIVRLAERNIIAVAYREALGILGRLLMGKVPPHPSFGSSCFQKISL